MSRSPRQPARQSERIAHLSQKFVGHEFTETAAFANRREKRRRARDLAKTARKKNRGK